MRRDIFQMAFVLIADQISAIYYFGGRSQREKRREVFDQIKQKERFSRLRLRMMNERGGGGGGGGGRN